jgi:hypothetical protein
MQFVELFKNPNTFDNSKFVVIVSALEYFKEAWRIKGIIKNLEICKLD